MVFVYCDLVCLLCLTLGAVFLSIGVRWLKYCQRGVKHKQFFFNILIYCLFNQYTFQCQNLQATLPLTVPTPSFIVNIPYLTSQRREYVLQTVKALLQHVE